MTSEAEKKCALDVNELLRSTNRSYQIARGSPKETMQLNLVFEEENWSG